MTDLRVGHFYYGRSGNVLPKLNSAHGSETRNIINRAIEVLNQHGKTIQDLVAEGQLTEEQYAELLTTINGLVKSGEIDIYDLGDSLRIEVEKINDKINKGRGEVTSADLSQEVKEQMTGGSVAVVGENAVLKDNIVDGQVTPAKTTLFKKENVKINEYLRNRLITTYGYRQSADRISVTIPVVEGETLYIDKETGNYNAIGFLMESPNVVPSDNILGFQSEPTLPATIEVPKGAKYFVWTVGGSNGFPEVTIQRGKIHEHLSPDLDIYEWSDNVFKNQYEIGKVVFQSPSSSYARFSLSADGVTVVLPVKEGETFRLNKDSGNRNDLSFLTNYPAELPIDTNYPLFSSNLPAEITIPKSAKYMTWTVSDDNILPDITIQKKILKPSLVPNSGTIENEREYYPTVTKVNTSFSGIIEHEWRSTVNHVYTSPKVFVIDGFNTIYSTTDYGQTYKEEIKLDYKPTMQYSNMGHRMLFENSDHDSRTGTVRIYTDDYQFVSEKTDVWLPYNENGADGKPGVDGTWVFAEYVSAPAGGNLGLGVRVMMTRDNGETWQEKLKITDIDHIHSCRYDPYNRNHIYINTGDANVEMRNRWYASYDDGETWEHLAGGVLDGGQTPLIDGTFTSDKWMRTTALAMGVDTGPKGRNSIFFIHDNSPTGFVRYDKTLKKFQIIFDNLEGVAYGTTITDDGMYTIVQTPSDYDLLHYVLFPANDEDIDNPAAYKLFSVKLPKKGYRAMRRSSRQIDLAGNSIIGTNINYYSNMGGNLTNSENGKSLGIKVNFGWSNDGNGELKLTVMTRPIMPIY